MIAPRAMATLVSVRNEQLVMPIELHWAMMEPSYLLIIKEGGSALLRKSTYSYPKHTVIRVARRILGRPGLSRASKGRFAGQDCAYGKRVARKRCFSSA